MKRSFIFILTIFLIFSMTSCASVRTVSDFIENTIPNAIANYTKDAILPSQDASDGNQQSNTDTQTNANTNTNTIQKDDSEIDYPQLINLITTSTIKACVNITTNEYRSASSTMPLKSSVGSGVIFKADKKSSKVYRYYVLTNYHVVDLSDEYPYYSYIITDYQGNEYRASSPSWVTSTSVQKLCKEHDLAILEFETQNVLKTIVLDTKNLDIGQTVISIGQPKGQQNAITIGNIAGYTDINVKDDFIPEFDVIVHTSPIDQGNSGGPIISAELKLVGINFAGSWNDDGTFAYGYGIPIETVRKFIRNFGVSL